MKGDYSINEAMSQVRMLRLKDTVSHLQDYGDRHSWENQRASSEWAKREFEKAGLNVEQESYEYAAKNWPNVVARIEGGKKSDEVIMLIAHIDSIADNPKKIAPGADDNATGVAAVLEVARILREVRVERTVLFCIFTNEEHGSAGSKSFALRARDNSMNIKAVVNLDVLGYNTPALFSFVGATASHYTFKHKLKALYRIVRNYFVTVRSGRGSVKIAGRLKDAYIVSAAEQMFGKYTDIKVKNILDDNECG